MRMLPLGRDAVLVEVGSLAGVLGLHARLVASPPPGVVDIVPAAETVAVHVDRAVLTLGAARAWIARSADAAAPRGATSAPVVLPVRYDGVDLEDVAAMLGASADAVVARHAATEWVVAFTGFAPGFGYLVGAGWERDIPRRASPRPRVPAGAVGLAGAFTGAYPRESPGGWQLIGTTGAPLFDPDAARPALLSPGAPVRFEPVRPRSRALAPTPVPSPGPAPVPPAAASSARGATRGRGGGMRGIRVLSPGVRSTVQDGGRPGRAAEGIAVSGAADRAAWALANRLLGNRPDAAAIEVVMGGLRAVAACDLAVVVTGAWAPVVIDGRAVDPFVVHPWPAGAELRLDTFAAGSRAYLGVRGGWDVEPVVGSRSTDTLSGLGPPPLRTGDLVPVGTEVAGELPALPFHPWGFPDVGTDAAPLDVPFVPGPRDDWLTPATRDALETMVWTVSAAADRIGVRLEGPRLERARGGELASEGAVPGAVQVPPAGQPVVFGVDGPVTGGYPVVGVVTDAGLDRLAQARPGDRVRLRRTGGPAPTADDR